MTTDYAAYGDSMDAAMMAGMAGFMMVYYLIILVVSIVCLIGMWKIFSKAGKPGWAAIIPFYNTYCLYEISMGNGWLFLLSFVPCVNFVFQIIVLFKLAKAFGRGVGFGFGLLLLTPIFYMILGFGESEYIGPQ